VRPRVRKALKSSERTGVVGNAHALEDLCRSRGGYGSQRNDRKLLRSCFNTSHCGCDGPVLRGSVSEGLGDGS